MELHRAYMSDLFAKYFTNKSLCSDQNDMLVVVELHSALYHFTSEQFNCSLCNLCN